MCPVIWGGVFLGVYLVIWWITEVCWDAVCALVQSKCVSQAMG